MTPGTVKAIESSAITLMVLIGGFYAIVLYPYDLDQLVKGAIIGFMGMAINHAYGEQVASRTSHQDQRAFDQGLGATPTQQGDPT